MSIPTTILSIDPGAKSPSGLAVVTIDVAPKLVFVCEARLTKETATTVVDRVLLEIEKLGFAKPPCAVIEAAYLDKNVRTAMILSRAFGRWEEACLSNGLSTNEAQASKWQAAELLGRGRKKQRTPRELRKKIAIAKAAGIWGKKDFTEHEADAALLGRWMAIQLFYKRPIPRP